MDRLLPSPCTLQLRTVDCPASAWQSFPGLRHYPDCGEESGVPGIGEQNVTYPDTKVERVEMSAGW